MIFFDGRMRGSLLMGFVGLSLATPGLADMFHYNNVIIGERAQGMAGAYSGISDDASGVFYNPAGLAFAQSNDISGSANAFYDKKVTYKNVFEGHDFTETSGGTFSPFFGAMQKLDHVLKGLVAGFAYYTTDTELTDQKDLIPGAKVTSSVTYNMLRRTMNRRASTTGASVGAGYRLSPDLSIGLSLTYINTDDLTQTYLMIDQTSVNSAGTASRNISSQNTRQRLQLYGMEPQIGFQWALMTKLVWGLTLKKGQYASQKFEQQYHFMSVGVGEEGGEAKSVNYVGSPPLQMRTGLALFASPDLLMAFDLTYTAAVDDMEPSYKSQNKRAAVTNYALGTEYYISPTVPVRLGVFTNSDARTNVIQQGESINYTGLSLFFGWAQPNSQVSLGTVVQKGTGTANKVGNGNLQTVEALAYTVGFSATHSF
jgi:hypothetical protein